MATGLIGTNDGANAVFDVKIRWQHGASIHQTGFSCRRAGALLGGPQELAEHVDTNLRTAVLGFITGLDNYLGVDVVNPITKIGGTVEPSGVVGTVGQPVGPAFLAGVVSLKSGLRSRIGQGRMFLPVYSDDFVSGDTITGGGVTVLQNFVTALMGTYTGNPGNLPWQLVNWHRALPAGRPNGTNPDLPAVAATWYDVVSARLNLGVTSLRSRKVGIGS